MPDVVLFFPKLRPVEEAILLPISITSVAAPIHDAGLSVEIIDQRVVTDWRARLSSCLNGHDGKRPLYVGFSCMTGAQIYYAIDAAAHVARIAPGVPRVWGGVHPTLFPFETLQDPHVDIVVAGEGDHAGRDLAFALRDGHDPTDPITGIPGVFRIGADGLMKGRAREGYHDMNELPDVPYHLIEDMEVYIGEGLVGGRGGREIAYFTSRGCPFRCGFCYVPAVHNRRWRALEPETVIERYKHAQQRFNLNAFGLQDDYFFANPERARKICQGIIDAKLDIRWFATCRIDLIGKHIDKPFLKLIRDSGCRVMAFGIESGSDRVLEYIKKDFTKDRILRVNRLLGESGIAVKYYFVAGFPTETEAELYETLDLMKRLRAEGGQVRIPPWRVYVPYPGACLFDESIRYGFEAPKNLPEWGRYEFDQVHLPWITPRMQRIIEAQPRLIRYLGVNRKRGGPMRHIGNAYSRWIDWRWQRHMLDYTPEHDVVDMAVKLKRRFSKVKVERKRHADLPDIYMGE